MDGGKEIVQKEDIKKLCCRKCKQELVIMPQGFSVESFLSQVKLQYCTNKECEWFGVVVVAGIYI